MLVQCDLIFSFLVLSQLAKLVFFDLKRKTINYEINFTPINQITGLSKIRFLYSHNEFEIY